MPSTYVHLQQLHRQRQQQSSSSSSALSNARFPTSRRRGGGRGRGTYRVLRPDGDNEDDGRPARTRGYVRHRMYQVSVGSSATTLSSAAGNKTWLTVAIQAFATYAAVRSSLWQDEFVTSSSASAIRHRARTTTFSTPSTRRIVDLFSRIAIKKQRGFIELQTAP